MYRLPGAKAVTGNAPCGNGVANDTGAIIVGAKMLGGRCQWDI